MDLLAPAEHAVLALPGVAAGPAEEGDLGDGHGHLEPEVAVDDELAVLGVLEGDPRRVRVEGLAVVEEQLAAGRAVLGEGDEDLEVAGAELLGGVGRGLARGEDDAGADEEGDVGGVDVGESVEGGAAADGLVGVPVVEEVVGQVGIDAGGALGEDRGNKEAGAVEKLVLQGPGLLILGVHVEHGRQHGAAVGGGPGHGGVHVVEQAVADGDGLAGALGNRLPEVELLPGGAELVVVPVKGVERAEGRPAGAQLLGRVATESADVRAYHGELEHGGIGYHCADGDTVVLPGREVVTKPVTDLVPSTGEGAASDDEGALARSAVEHGVVRSDGHHGPV